MQALHILLISFVVLFSLIGCSQGETIVKDRSLTPCGDKPNCVSTLDTREEFNVAPFVLTSENITMDAITEAVTTLPRTKLISTSANYSHITFTTKILRFVDDVEFRIQDEQLIVRSESRVGHSDFGVNRKRVESIRVLLKQSGLIQ